MTGLYRTSTGWRVSVSYRGRRKSKRFGYGATGAEMKKWRKRALIMLICEVESP